MRYVLLIINTLHWQIVTNITHLSRNCDRHMVFCHIGKSLRSMTNVSNPLIVKLICFLRMEYCRPEWRMQGIINTIIYAFTYVMRWYNTVWMIYIISLCQKNIVWAHEIFICEFSIFTSFIYVFTLSTFLFLRR